MVLNEEKNNDDQRDPEEGEDAPKSSEQARPPDSFTQAF